MQDDTTDELVVIAAHTDFAPTRSLRTHEGFWQKIVQVFPVQVAFDHLRHQLLSMASAFKATILPYLYRG